MDPLLTPFKSATYMATIIRDTDKNPQHEQQSSLFSPVDSSNISSSETNTATTEKDRIIHVNDIFLNTMAKNIKKSFSELTKNKPLNTFNSLYFATKIPITCGGSNTNLGYNSKFYSRFFNTLSQLAWYFATSRELDLILNNIHKKEVSNILDALTKITTIGYEIIEIKTDEKPYQQYSAKLLFTTPVISGYLCEQGIAICITTTPSRKNIMPECELLYPSGSPLCPTDFKKIFKYTCDVLSETKQQGYIINPDIRREITRRGFKIVITYRDNNDGDIIYSEIKGQREFCGAGRNSTVYRAQPDKNGKAYVKASLKKDNYGLYLELFAQGLTMEDQISPKFMEIRGIIKKDGVDNIIKLRVPTGKVPIIEINSNNNNKNKINLKIKHLGSYGEGELLESIDHYENLSHKHLQQILWINLYMYKIGCPLSDNFANCLVDKNGNIIRFDIDDCVLRIFIAAKIIGNAFEYQGIMASFSKELDPQKAYKNFLQQSIAPNKTKDEEQAFFQTTEKIVKHYSAAREELRKLNLTDLQINCLQGIAGAISASFILKNGESIFQDDEDMKLAKIIEYLPAENSILIGQIDETAYAQFLYNWIFGVDKEDFTQIQEFFNIHVKPTCDNLPPYSSIFTISTR